MRDAWWPWHMVLESDMETVRSFSAVGDDICWKVGGEIYIDYGSTGQRRKYQVTKATLLGDGVTEFNVEPMDDG